MHRSALIRPKAFQLVPWCATPARGSRRHRYISCWCHTFSTFQNLRASANCNDCSQGDAQRMRHTLDLIMRVRQHSQPDLILASNGPERDMVRQNSGSSCSSTGSWNGNRDTYRLVVLGAGGVGKSSLVSRYVLGEFTRVYQPTLEDSYRHLVQLPGESTLRDFLHPMLYLAKHSQSLWPM